MDNEQKAKDYSDFLERKENISQKNTEEDFYLKEKTKEKRSLKEKWNDLERKQKIEIVVFIVVLILIAVTLVSYSFAGKSSEETPKFFPAEY